MVEIISLIFLRGSLVCSRDFSCEAFLPRSFTPCPGTDFVPIFRGHLDRGVLDNEVVIFQTFQICVIEHRFEILKSVWQC